MKGLLLKEWINLKKNMGAVLFISLIFLIAGLFTTDSNLTMAEMVPLLFGGQIINLFGYDEKSGFTCFALTLPITPRLYIRSKYLVSGLLIAVSCLFLAIWLGVYYFLYAQIPLYISIGLFLSIYLTVVFVFIVIPLLFRIGTERARLMTALMMISCFLVAIIIASLMGLFKYKMIHLSTLSLGMIASGLILLLILGGKVSMYFSIKWFHV